ncbi:MAG: CHAD domain-containing protein [Acidobacteriaceae bacterium]|jgi:CHAD domain-containing protein
MARAKQTTHPVQVLRETALLLGASIRACLAHPGKEPVHQLRTTTRRIEALFVLLSMLPSLPPHREQADKALRLFKRLRRAAGQVRDIDVQRDLVEKEAEAVPGEPPPDPALQGEARRLSRELKRKRDQHADSLLRLLRREQAEVALAFDDLLDALAPSEAIKLTQAELIALIRGWYAQHVPPRPAAAASQSAEELHEIRKCAKLARYIAESAPESARRTRNLGAKFEGLQKAGGEWHDHLLLADIAAVELGKTAQLTQRFAAQAEIALSNFRRCLRYKI